MAKPPQVGEWFIEQRTRSLATIFLTRRDDLFVTEAKEEYGVDLQVDIKLRKQAGTRRFGVILKGTKNELSAKQANSLLRPTMEDLGTRAFSYPVCLFFLQMTNDQGFHTWVAEPIVTAEASPVLRYHGEAACAPLDTSAIDAMVGSVNAWYDAFSEKVMNRATRPRKPSGLEVLHAIIDGEAAYFSEYGKAPTLLKLPMLQAYELAKLGREHLGDLAGRFIKEGVRVLEKEGLLGMKVKLTSDQQGFSFE